MDRWFEIGYSWVDYRTRTHHYKIICRFRNEQDAKAFYTGLREGTIIAYDDDSKRLYEGPVKFKYTYHIDEVYI